MITIYICIYVSLYESTEEQKCLVPCELLNDITIIACIIIIVNKTRNANAIQSCSYEVFFHQFMGHNSVKNHWILQKF